MKLRGGHDARVHAVHGLQSAGRRHGAQVRHHRTRPARGPRSSAPPPRPISSRRARALRVLLLAVPVGPAASKALQALGLALRGDGGQPRARGGHQPREARRPGASRARPRRRGCRRRPRVLRVLRGLSLGDLRVPRRRLRGTGRVWPSPAAPRASGSVASSSSPADSPSPSARPREDLAVVAARRAHPRGAAGVRRRAARARRRQRARLEHRGRRRRHRGGAL